MNELTPLEMEVMSAILLSLTHDQDKVAEVTRSLSISGREFSRDVANNERCSGFYLNFEPNSSLANIKNVPHHLSVQGSHADTPAGGDFILFFSEDKAGINFLEGSFFDYTLPIAMLVSDKHGFVIRADADQ
jgi:hypothetical protein